MLAATHLAGFGAGGQYRANAVYFDGTNDWLTRGGGLTGAADSKKVTFAFSYKPPTAASSQRVFLHGKSSGGTTRFKLSVESDNKFNFFQRDTANNVARSLTSANTLTAGAWHKVIGSFDGVNAHLYVNDASDISVSTNNDAVMDLTLADWAVGGNIVASSPNLYGDLADLWVAFGVYLDLSIEDNRRKFFDANGKPVFLGETGELPTGSSPIVFLSGPTAAWHTNKGTGGGFTENGALTDSTTSPSD